MDFLPIWEIVKLTANIWHHLRKIFRDVTAPFLFSRYENTYSTLRGFIEMINVRRINVIFRKMCAKWRACLMRIIYRAYSVCIAIFVRKIVQRDIDCIRTSIVQRVFVHADVWIHTIIFLIAASVFWTNANFGGSTERTELLCLHDKRYKVNVSVYRSSGNNKVQSSTLNSLIK